MNYPLISIVIATFNSERTLSKTLESIQKQAYPQNKIEVLAIDGGSTDKTTYILKKNECRILLNPKTELIFAKHIGFLKAKGKYLMFLDHDEILENSNSLKLKCLAFRKNPEVKSVIPSGYKTPKDYSPINYYVNEFGDPFSLFIYRESKGYNFLIKDWRHKYKIKYEDKNMIIFSLFCVNSLPLIELWAGGCMIDLEYMKSTFPQIQKNPSLVAHLFYLLNNDNKLIAVTKNDNTIHFSSENLLIYLKKLNTRVKNSVYKTPMGRAGFLGREKFNPLRSSIKKYLFVPYALLILPSLIDSVYLILTRRKLLYLIHLPLSIYIAFLIIYYFFLRAVGFKSKIEEV